MSSYHRFDEHVFRSKVDKALKTVEQILEVHRHPKLAEHVDHVYENKYDLANRMTNTAIIAQMNCLHRLGLTLEVIKQLDTSKSTTLRFQASEKCTFLKEQTVEIPSEVSYETQEERTTTSGGSFFGNSKKKMTYTMIKKVQEYHWAVNTNWELSVFSGTNVDQKIVLQSRESSSICVTQSKDAPMESTVEHSPLDVSLTWFLQHIDIAKAASNFTINTETSKTPRRNEQVEDAMEFFCSRFSRWVSNVKAHFFRHIQLSVINKHNPAVPEPSNHPTLSENCTAQDLFYPILPLMEEVEGESEPTTIDGSGVPPSESVLVLTNTSFQADESNDRTLLSGKDCIDLLNEQVRSIEAKMKGLQEIFPSSSTQDLIVSVLESHLYFLCDYLENLGQQYQMSMVYLEKMLENQLVAAIGKRVSTSDLEQFVRFHNAKFLSHPPKPFCFSIGRPNHFPYGLLSIESNQLDDKFEPIETLVRPVETSTPLKIPLNAATTLQLTGNTYLHGWMNHRSNMSGQKGYQLSARARQFSSFLLVVGTMSGADTLKPKDAIILQNKDEVIIPLLLDEIPSAKEFKDAIKSLSPEQQRFANSFRSMQLESSVFGVCVIQIKPQLEALLGLPEDSLAKEIKLTEDLMQLFGEYQVPSDLLSYDGDTARETTVHEKVENVREHVKAVLGVIEAAKEKQLEEATMKADMAIESEIAFHAPGAFQSMAMPVGGAPPVEGAKERRLKKKIAPQVRSGAMPQRSMVYAKAAQPPPMPSYEMASMDAMDMMDDFAAITELSVEGQIEDQESGPASSETSTNRISADAKTFSFTNMPKILDATIEKYDRYGALRSTTVKSANSWTRNRQASLLENAVTSALHASDVKSETNKAFDLLDALSRSGSLSIAYSDLHVVLCVTHCFEKDVMETVVQDNINPIERLEVSTLLLGSTIYGVAPMHLLAETRDRERLERNLPYMLEG